MASDTPTATSTGEAAFEAARDALLKIRGMTTLDAQRYAARALGAALPIIAAGFAVESEAAIDEALETFEAKSLEILASELAPLRAQLAAAEHERDRARAEVAKLRRLDGQPADGVRVVPGRDGVIRIGTDDHLSDENLAVLMAWCEANDMDAGLIPGDSVICVHGGQIEFEERVAVTVGPNRLKGFRADEQPIRRTVPLVVPIPAEWIWRPHG